MCSTTFIELGTAGLWNRLYKHKSFKFNNLSESLIRAYDRPNSHKLGKPIVSSWLASQALRTSWDLEDTNKVNELLDYHGLQYRINHENVIKDLQDHRNLWVKKYLNHNP